MLFLFTREKRKNEFVVFYKNRICVTKVQTQQKKTMLDIWHTKKKKKKKDDNTKLETLDAKKKNQGIMN
jgi:hypothetical protein